MVLFLLAARRQLNRVLTLARLDRRNRPRRLMQPLLGPPIAVMLSLLLLQLVVTRVRPGRARWRIVLVVLYGLVLVRWCLDNGFLLLAAALASQAEQACAQEHRDQHENAEHDAGDGAFGDARARCCARGCRR
jgi:hypothetical protein